VLFNLGHSEIKNVLTLGRGRAHPQDGLKMQDLSNLVSTCIRQKQTMRTVKQGVRRGEKL